MGILKHDISNIEDIELMVHSFYERTRKDELLGPIFNEKVGDWSKHLPLMYSFWSSMLLAAQTYSGTPFAKHAQLQIDPSHFERWFDIFIENLDEHFTGKVSEQAKFIARNVAMSFQMRLGFKLTDEQTKKYTT